MKRILDIVFICFASLFIISCQVKPQAPPKPDDEIITDMKNSVNLSGWEDVEVIIERRERTSVQGEEVVYCVIEMVRSGTPLIDRMKKMQKYKINYLYSGDNQWKLQSLEEMTEAEELTPIEGVKKSKIELQLQAIFDDDDMLSRKGKVKYKISQREIKLKEKADTIVILLEKDNEEMIRCELNYEFIDRYACWCLIDYSCEKP